MMNKLWKKETKYTFKKKIQLKIRELSRSELEGVKSGHEKVRSILHDISNEPQLYLTSGKFTNAQKVYLIYSIALFTIYRFPV